MKTTKCKTCGSADVTVTVVVNPNDFARIIDYYHDDETITEQAKRYLDGRVFGSGLTIYQGEGFIILGI